MGIQPREPECHFDAGARGTVGGRVQSLHPAVQGRVRCRLLKPGRVRGGCGRRRRRRHKKQLLHTLLLLPARLLPAAGPQKRIVKKEKKTLLCAKQLSHCI